MSDNKKQVDGLYSLYQEVNSKKNTTPDLNEFSYIFCKYCGRGNKESVISKGKHQEEICQICGYVLVDRTFNAREIAKDTVENLRHAFDIEDYDKISASVDKSNKLKEIANAPWNLNGNQTKPQVSKKKPTSKIAMITSKINQKIRDEYVKSLIEEVGYQRRNETIDFVIKSNIPKATAVAGVTASVLQEHFFLEDPSIKPEDLYAKVSWYMIHYLHMMDFNVHAKYYHKICMEETSSGSGNQQRVLVHGSNKDRCKNAYKTMCEDPDFGNPLLKEMFCSLK